MENIDLDKTNEIEINTDDRNNDDTNNNSQVESDAEIVSDSTIENENNIYSDNNSDDNSDNVVNDSVSNNTSNTNNTNDSVVETENIIEYDMNLLQSALDGILLVRTKAIPMDKVAEFLQVPEEIAEQVVKLRKNAYDNDDRSGLQLVVIESGVQLATKAKVAKYIKKMSGQRLVTLSLPALETLSVIAFKQPVTKAEIEAIRGVDCGGVVSTLLEKKLVYVAGEKQVIGRPRLYATTQDFLYYFGMKSLKELPIPSIDVPFSLTPEGIKKQNADDKESEQNIEEEKFNQSQGLISLDKDETTDNITTNDSEEKVEKFDKSVETTGAETSE